MLDFPNNPIAGQLFQSPQGSTWQWDGSTKWMPQVAGTQPITVSVGRNLLHNSLFNVAQRGAGPSTTFGYLADRWYLAQTTDTVSVSIVPVSDAARAAIGDEAATSHWQNTFTGNAAAGAYNLLTQPVENVRRLSGKTVTVSFWATASAALKLGVSIDQYFGTGGSPTARVNGNGQSITISTNYARYSLTFAVPSVAGLTLGTNGDNLTGLNIWFSSGATNATRSGNVGVQSGTVQLWGVQLEIGTTATPLEKPDPRYDLANCQRFYQVGNFNMNAYNVAGQWTGYGTAFPVTMRAVPTIVTTPSIQTNISSQQVTAQSAGYISVQATATAGGATVYVGTFTASADL